jgi:hypothetical protein
MPEIEKSKENLEKCNCLKCPTYTIACKIQEMPHNMFEIFKGTNSLSGLEAMFCAYTKSRCIDEDNGCLCEVCEVHAKHELKCKSYCLQDGGEKCAHNDTD